MEKYFKAAKKMGIIPNFWLTKEYLNIQDIEIKQVDGLIWIQEGEWAIFPPLPENPENQYNIIKKYPIMDIWSDFTNYSLGEPIEFLDWEYVYQSNNFKKMEGKKWGTFRKNIKKWPGKNKNWEYNMESPTTQQINRLLINWLEGKNEEEIHDYESMLWFLHNGKNRSFLYCKGKLVGINVWDFNKQLNEKYIMYRYCVTEPEEPFLNEFVRYLFYMGLKDSLVIDGGSLGNPGLERFKDKLNPVLKREIYSKRIGG